VEVTFPAAVAEAAAFRAAEAVGGFSGGGGRGFFRRSSKGLFWRRRSRIRRRRNRGYGGLEATTVVTATLRAHGLIPGPLRSLLRGLARYCSPGYYDQWGTLDSRSAGAADTATVIKWEIVEPPRDGSGEIVGRIRMVRAGPPGPRRSQMNRLPPAGSATHDGCKLRDTSGKPSDIARGLPPLCLGCRAGFCFKSPFRGPPSIANRPTTAGPTGPKQIAAAN